MTREEAIELAMKACEETWNEKTCKQIREALEQEPSGDLISRQAVIDGIEELKKSPWATDKRGNGFEYLIAEALDVVEDLCVKQASSVNPQEPSVEILKTEESNDNGTKYLNINVSDAEVKRNPDIVRLCSDVGMLEYVKPQTGHWIKSNIPNEKYVCSECGGASWYYDCQGDVAKSKYCPNCGAKMEEGSEE